MPSLRSAAARRRACWSSALSGTLEQPRRDMRRVVPARRDAIGAGARHRGRRADVRARDARVRQRRDAAGALRDRRHGGVRPAQQRDEDRRFARVEAGRRLAEQARERRRRGRRSSPRYEREVEIGLEDLLLRPRALERQRGLRLVPLLRRTCASRRAARAPGRASRRAASSASSRRAAAVRRACARGCPTPRRPGPASRRRGARRSACPRRRRAWRPAPARRRRAPPSRAGASSRRRATSDSGVAVAIEQHRFGR